MTAVVADWSDLWAPRTLLFVLAMLTFVMAGGIVGHFWRRIGWAWRTLALGALALLLYAMVGQIKAFQLQVPFDLVSWGGVAAYLLGIAGLLLVRHKERSTNKGA